MKRSKFLSDIVISIGLLVFVSVAIAGEAHDDNHQHGHEPDQHDHQESMSHSVESSEDSMFLVEKDIDDYNVSFHVMKAKPGKKMGGSHDFMIKVEKNGKVQGELVMNTKVVHPDGTTETKKTMKMGDWYMVGYDLEHEGKHQLMILFKTAGGKKHKGGVYYP
jgi:hypothetical protein